MLTALLLAALAAACSSVAPSEHGVGGAPGKGLYVQSEWRTNRRAIGHQVHVLEQRIACSRCHTLDGSSVGAVSPSRCATCHADQARIEHAASQAAARLGHDAEADCVMCHAFTSDGNAHDQLDGGVLEPFSAKDCARCHLKDQGRIPAVVAHATSECLSCHRPHQDRTPVAADCASCHRDIHTEHAAQGKSANGVCTTCHTHQHAPASDALGTCVECHSKTRPIVPSTALFADGHRQCVGCHRPHELLAKQAVPCRSCHAEVTVLAQAKVPAHAACTSCHTAHDVRADPAAACAKCHWDVHSDQPERVAGATCTTCHDAHPRREQAQTLARACSSCHQVAASEHAFHGGATCQKCHTPHHFKLDLTQRSLCQSCHQKEVTLTATRTGHLACGSCHGGLPHQPTVLAGACSTCHATEQHATRVGHTVCTGCHEPHAGGVAKDCRSCHAQEHSTAPEGHRACTNCHEPHTGSPSKAACASCHVAEARSPHAEVATGCLTCHRPHGPNGVTTTPACTTCHQLGALPGLHQKTPHQDCRRCHGGHGDAPNAQRLVCLTCHADRKSHFPDARCANCHLFQNAANGLKAP
ncbi:MAG: hypothetical protein ABW061_23820 [Polyangiaceae bacterium]